LKAKFQILKTNLEKNQIIATLTHVKAFLGLPKEKLEKGIVNKAT
jgi:hypothetical protein